LRSTDEIEEEIADLRRLKGTLEELQKRLDEKRTRITLFLGEHPSLVNGEGHELVTWKNVSTTRLDTGALKRENPELYEKFSKTTSTRTLRLNS
jgi:predicted phage-related endonuclease